MRKEILIQSASNLKQPGNDALHDFEQKQEIMLTTINNRFKNRPDHDYLIGEGNLEMMMNNHHNHLRFMASLFGNYQPEVLVETILWVFRAYRTHGFRLAYWPAQLDTWVEIMKETLREESFKEIYPFYHWMIVNNPVFAILSDEMIRGVDQLKAGELH
jgi:hypothetical protein